jgi:hypothetical protein
MEDALAVEVVAELLVAVLRAVVRSDHQQLVARLLLQHLDDVLGRTGNFG